MDEQRAWIKMRRKRRLRVLAVVLCLSVLFVTYPNILETLSVFASENGSEENVLYVSGFCDISDEIKEQTVPVGTGMEELALPDTLKAYMAQADEDSSVDIDKDADDREDEEADQGTEEQPDGEEADQGTEEQPGGEEADQETEEQSDGEETGTEDQGAGTEETDENVQETMEESGDTEQNTDTQKEEQDAQPEEIATADTDAETRQETHTVALQEYQAGNEITVNRLEDSSEESTETDNIENRQSDDADTITITGITWQSNPAYDKEIEDDYIFTAVLPEGYVLMEDVSLPQIVVTVKESENVRFFLERAEALPDLESMIEDAPGEDEKGYGEWETRFLEFLSEAESLREMYDAFTETEQAQIPEDIYEKLAAWWEYADLMEEGTVYVSGTGWELNGSGVLTIESDEGMLDWRKNGRTTDNIGNVKQIVIKDGVTSMGEEAFRNCSSLTGIEIPSSVTSMGKSAFQNCSNLTGIEIPSSVTSMEEAVFEDCSSLTGIEIPSSVTSIGNRAFSGCSSLTEIVIPENVTRIGTYVFNGCSSLTEIVIPENVTSIGVYVFYDCSSLTEIVIPENVTSIGAYVFYRCSSLTEIAIPENVTSIGSHAFHYCSSLTEIAIPENVTSIGSYAFSGCSELTSINIPSGVTSIGEDAFSGCEKLTEITIPENVTSIGSGAFADCSELAKVEMLSETPPVTLGSYAFIGCNFVTANKKGILVPVGKVEDYKGAAGWSDYADYITDGTPQVTEQPTDQTAQNGKTATFSITAEGEGTLEYQWQVDKKKGTFENIANATSSTYTISNVTKTYDGYKYQCKVTNDKRTVTSDEAVLTVTDSDAEIVAAAKKVVQDTLADITATNETTKESIQNAIDTALANADMTDVTVEVGNLTKAEATTGKTGSIGGSISITSKNDSSVKDSVAISKTIAKLPSSEEEKVEAAKAIVQEALAGITATNETTKASIQNAIDTALAEAGIADVTVKVENLTKTEATTGKTGSISGSISITSKRDSSVKASVSINKTIPATGEEEPDKDKPSGSGSGTSKPHRPKPTDTPQQTDTPDQTDTQRPTDTPLETPAQTQPTVPLVPGTANSLDGQPVTPQMQPQGIPGQGAGQENTAMVRQGDTDSAGTETEQTPANGTVQTDTTQQSGSGTVQTDTTQQSANGTEQTDATQQPQGRTVSAAAADDGRIIISGEPVATGNLTEELETTTKLEVGRGAVIVTVVCEDKYTAAVTDTVSVVNAVLAPEQVQLINDGENIEVRIDVKDISETVAGQDKEVIESGLTQYREQIPGLTIGMYADISMFIRMGEGDWDAVTSTKEPIEVVIGIPEEFRQHGREFYIIRSHEGEYTLLTDMDDDPETITISTDMFSAYAIAYVETGKNGAGDGARCGLCHICPTFLGICCFVWLAVILLAVLTVVLVVLRRRKEGAGKTGIGI